MNWRKKLGVVTKGPRILKDLMACDYCKTLRVEMRNCYIARGGDASAKAGGSPAAVLYFYKNLRCQHCLDLYEKMQEHAHKGHPPITHEENST